MVSEPMACYLRKLQEKNGKLMLVMDVENSWKGKHGGQNHGIAIRWDSANLYEYSTPQMADLIGGLFLLMCKGDWVDAMNILDKHEKACNDWIKKYNEGKEKDGTPSPEEVAKVKELNRMDQNKPRQGVDE